MFTSTDREQIRARILEKAQSDPRLTGGAITGSASLGNEDAWSDIDLAFGVRSGTTLAEVLADYTEFMVQSFGVVDRFDVRSGAWVYRVFLLANTLQVDLAFAPESEFGARAPSFQLQFGKAAELPEPARPEIAEAVGYGWLYALHARSSLARNKLWQAEYFVSAMRNQTLMLACLRLGLPHRDGRGFDRLPTEVHESLRNAFAANLTVDAIQTAFQAVTRAFLAEVKRHDTAKAGRVASVLDELCG